MAVTDSEPFVFYYVFLHSIFFKREMLYRDFVLLLCYIVRSCVIVVLRVYGCACAVSAEHEE